MSFDSFSLIFSFSPIFNMFFYCCIEKKFIFSVSFSSHQYHHQYHYHRDRPRKFHLILAEFSCNNKPSNTSKNNTNEKKRNKKREKTKRLL